jgi:hypothetical protein
MILNEAEKGEDGCEQGNRVQVEGTLVLKQLAELLALQNIKSFHL